MTVAAVAAKPKAPKNVPMPAPVYIPRYLEFLQIAKQDGVIDATVNGKFDMTTADVAATEPSTMHVDGTIMGDPVNQTVTGKVDLIERGYMAAVRDAFVGSDLLNRSIDTSNKTIAPPEPNSIRFTFAGQAGETRYYDVTEASATPADQSFLETIEKYGEYAFGQEA
jgi:hypothetical protein